MSQRELKQGIERLGRGLLSTAEFQPRGPLCFERGLPGLTQGVEFLLGTGTHKGLFTVNLYWRFTNSPIVNEDSMDFWQRLGIFLGGSDEWYGIKSEQLETSIPWLEEVLRDRVLPFFDRFKSLDAVLKAYEQGEVDQALLFGVDAGWREYNLGYAYLSLGDHERAAKHLREVLERFSAGPQGWVQERRRTVETTLSGLTRGRADGDCS